MDSAPLIRASQLSPFVQALERLGIPPEPLLRRMGLPADWRDAPDSMVEERRLWRLLDEVARSKGLDDYGLRAGLGGRIADIGNFGLRLLESVTLHQALGVMCAKVDDHSSDAQFGLRPGGGLCWFWRRGIASIEVGEEQAEQYTLMLMIQLVRLARPGWTPSRVRLRASMDRWTAASDWLSSARVERGRVATAIAVPTCLLSQPLVRQAPGAPMSGQQDPSRELGARLREALAPLLGEQQIGLGLAAEIAGTTPRTLERRLDQGGLSTRRLLDQIRCDASVDLLRDPRRPLTEVSQDLGYSDAANFTRAFRRWTGTTPTAFRQALTAAVPGGDPR